MCATIDAVDCNLNSVQGFYSPLQTFNPDMSLFGFGLFVLDRPAVLRHRALWKGMAGFITDYSASKFWGPSSAAGGNGGHSLSLFKRSYYTVFTQGASQLTAEAGAVNWFYQNVSKDDGILNLSPLGEVGREFSAFVSRTGARRGVSYNPVAIVLEPAHGFGESWSYDSRAWGSLILTEQEMVLTQLFKTIWGADAWTTMNEFKNPARSELGYMTASPYGDLFDVLQQPSRDGIAPISRATMHLYRVLWFAGDTVLESSFGAVKEVEGGAGMGMANDDLSALLDYCASGGTVVLRAAQLTQQQPTLTGLQISTLTGATFGIIDQIQHIAYAVDMQTGWEHTVAPVQGKTPFCDQALVSGGNISDSTTGSAWYIKVGGDRTKAAGWDGGKLDKCCRSGAKACRQVLNLNKVCLSIEFGQKPGCDAPYKPGRCNASG